MDERVFSVAGPSIARDSFDQHAIRPRVARVGAVREDQCAPAVHARLSPCRRRTRLSLTRDSLRRRRTGVRRARSQTTTRWSMKRSDAAFQLGGSGIRTLGNARIQPPRAANNNKFNLHASQSSKQLRSPALHPQCTPHTMILTFEWGTSATTLAYCARE